MLYTIGHGNRPIEELIGLLGKARIECLVDVRAHPGSRRHPQFGREALAGALAAAGIRYAWEGAALGGRRRPAPGSPHTALDSPSFRAYADHLATREAREGLERLLALARASPTAILCAERLPWRCHRNLIADCLALVHGIEVVHLGLGGAARVHRPNPAARLAGGTLVYDAGAQLSLAGIGTGADGASGRARRPRG